MLPEVALQALSAVAVEKEAKKYQSLRPTRSLFVLVHGAVANREDTHLSLTGPMPPELLTTVPDVNHAAAAAAVAIDGAVADEVTDAGATLGLQFLVGGLVVAPPSFLMLQPTLLLQLPVEAVHDSLQAGCPLVLQALGAEARLRMLLAHPTFLELSAPVPELRSLASLLQTVSAQDGAQIFEQGEPCEHLRLLMHGRVDLYDEANPRKPRLFRTVDATLPPPLGEMPSAACAAEPTTQPYSAVAAESTCLILRGGPAAADALTSLLAPRPIDEVPPPQPDGGSGNSSDAPQLKVPLGSGGEKLLAALSALKKLAAAGSSSSA